jgi:murein DD-endopeptidase MepM/ murein hydrolase activator NlpD
MRRLYAFALLLFIAGAFGALSTPPFLFAQTQEEIQAQIAERNRQIMDLEKEIANIQSSLDATSKQKQTLQNTVATLDLSRKKITADIKLTQTKIAQKDSEISSLGTNITKTTGKIGTQKGSIEESLRELNRTDSDASFLVSILSGENLGTFFQNGAALLTMREAMSDHVVELSSLKNNLVTTKTSAEKKREELATLKSDLTAQQRVLDANRQEKASLLSSTKNQESAYQSQLKAKQALHAQFENDLNDFQSKLNLLKDPSSIPHTGSGILRWPVDKPVITQYFGNTEFATQNPSIYNGHGHSGIDLRASPGTPIKAAASGVVKGTGDTDLTCPGASYGRWVMVEHSNGLSTLYAHLSVIRVSKGQSVDTGEIVGYSGSTGYATGPHLHFTVFASQGVQIQQLASKAVACKGRIYTMPVADLKAYLNPLSYL